tara:strand:+ start:5 stop:178 length:174 start_codon:yes stop_codon:yes gene_type:complete
MDVFLGFWMLTLLALTVSMPFTMLLYGYYRNKKSDEKLAMMVNEIILQEQKNNQKSA